MALINQRVHLVGLKFHWVSQVKENGACPNPSTFSSRSLRTVKTSDCSGLDPWEKGIGEELCMRENPMIYRRMEFNSNHMEVCGVYNLSEVDKIETNGGGGASFAV